MLTTLRKRRSWTKARPSTIRTQTEQLGIQEILRKAGVVIWEADLEMRAITRIGGPGRKIFGYPVTRWREPRFWEAPLPQLDRGRVLRFIAGSVQASESVLEYRLIGADGQVV